MDKAAPKLAAIVLAGGRSTRMGCDKAQVVAHGERLIDRLLRQLPQCKGVLAAGQLATQVFMQHFGIKQMPKMGCFAEFTFEGRKLRLYRVPSSSRAYPMAVEKKAAFYQKMFDDVLR